MKWCLRILAANFLLLVYAAVVLTIVLTREVP